MSARDASTHPLVKFALLLCPREFREEYAYQILDDCRRTGKPASIAVDTLRAGVVLRAENVGRDVAVALRALVRSPLFSTVAIVTIGLAIGVNVAVASVVNGVLLHGLPYPNANRLVFVSLDAAQRNAPSFLDGRDIAAQARSLARYAVVRRDARTVITHQGAASMNGRIVDGEYFRLLGTTPQLGRLLEPADIGTKRIVISSRVWREYFAGDVQTIGKPARFENAAYTIIGVAPDRGDPAPGGILSSDYWIPLDPRSDVAQSRGWGQDTMLAEIRSGFGLTAARADVSRVIGQLARRYPLSHPPTQFYVGGVTFALDAIVAPARALLWTLYAGVTLVLFICCVNVANLLLERAATREQETTLRVALGASRSHAVAQMATETLLLCALGGVVGLGAGVFALRWFASVGAQLLPRWDNVAIDESVAVYTCALVVLTTFVSTILPTLLQHRALARNLKVRERGNQRRAVKRSRTALIVLEIAFAISLTITAGLLLRSFVALVTVDVGFLPHGLYDVSYGGTPSARYPTAQRQTAFIERSLRMLRALPGIEAASESDALPFGDYGTTSLALPGRSVRAKGDTYVYAIDRQFFSTMGIRLLRGRSFDERDRLGSRPVAIVSATLARTYFGTLDVVGKAIRPGQLTHEPSPVRTIIGVVSDVRQDFASPLTVTTYMPRTQFMADGHFIIRIDGRADFATGVRHILKTVDPLMPPPTITSLSALMDAYSVQRRGAAMLFGALALVALVLAFAGVYAVTSYAVEERTHEFGIRMAIGARPAGVVWNVLYDTALTSATGVIVGLALTALFASRLGDMLFRVSPLDLPTFSGVIMLLMVCSLSAAFVPALRATRIQPARALRYD